MVEYSFEEGLKGLLLFLFGFNFVIHGLEDLSDFLLDGKGREGNLLSMY